jgi:uncharacterized DUF497 family protein
VPAVKVEWDEGKDRENQRKHGLSFEEAQRVFSPSGDYLELFDEAHSDVEERFIAIGPIRRGIVVVVWTERAENVLRIISARFATPRERVRYRSYLERQT